MFRLSQDHDTFRDSVDLSVTHIRQRELPVYVHEYREELGLSNNFLPSDKTYTSSVCNSSTTSPPIISAPCRSFAPAVVISSGYPDSTTSSTLVSISASSLTSASALDTSTIGLNNRQHLTTTSSSTLPHDHEGNNIVIHEGDSSASVVVVDEDTPERLKRSRDHDGCTDKCRQDDRVNGEVKKLKISIGVGNIK